jgi:predicted acylesterase/phospholipase RssA
MSVPAPFGVALSGGGFRATAFHLGVLKRLRELHLLEKINVLSTVSGGSIVGAFWVYWQACCGDTIHDEAQWNQFEQSLVRVMRRGLRGRVLLYGMGIPLLVGESAVILLWTLWPVRPLVAALLGLVFLILAIVMWHYSAARLLERGYDSLLFSRARLKSMPAQMKDLGHLRHPERERHWPRLVVSACSLERGTLLVFNNNVENQPGADMIDKWVLSKDKTLPRRRTPEPQHGNTPLARAVAASSAFPFVFTPIRLPSPLEGFPLEAPSFTAQFPPSVAVDGGVFDNQGTQFLLNGNCRGLLVSDAAAALERKDRPSTWQLLPPFRGVVSRSRDIIYERSRDLGYARLADRHAFTKWLRGLNLLEQAVQSEVPVLDGYAYVELRPSERFRWDADVGRLPDRLIDSVASIRTDLDSFSEIEISALMFHGYSLIDHCLRAYHPDWIPQPPPAACFKSQAKGISIDWKALNSDEEAKYERHLRASGSRIQPLRIGKRLLSWLVSEALRLGASRGTPVSRRPRRRPRFRMKREC